MYRRLDLSQIIQTNRVLCARISERFPRSGLLEVASEVLRVAEDSGRLCVWLARPLWFTRALVVLAIGLILLALVSVLPSLGRGAALSSSVADLLQGFDAAVNEIILVGAAIYFLTRWEAHLKRARAMPAIHVFRSLAHIIDMHQLTKDPERVVRSGSPTKASPVQSMSRFELTRYLTYCSELLAIVNKLGAITVQDFDDPQTLAAVDQVQDLCGDLSQKIWHKIMILDMVASG